ARIVRRPANGGAVLGLRGGVGRRQNPPADQKSPGPIRRGAATSLAVAWEIYGDSLVRETRESQRSRRHRGTPDNLCLPRWIPASGRARVLADQRGQVFRWPGGGLVGGFGFIVANGDRRQSTPVSLEFRVISS